MIFDFKGSNSVYSAPILGNGSIALCVGPDGSMNDSGSQTIVKDLPGRSIWWAARRYVGELTHPLIPFGRFTDSVNGTPLYASQELDAFRAEVTCDTQYDTGSIKTKVFVHTEYNMVVIKKILDPKQRMNFVFTYSFCDRNDDNRAVYFSECEVKKTKNGGEICYRMLDREGYNGSINVGCDKATDISVGKHSVKFSVNADSKCELTFVIVLSDSIDTLAPSDFTNELLKMTLSDGYDATKAYHGKVWSDYYEEGYAQTGDDLLDKVYLVAQYHQKCFTTKWSLPVGLNDATWHGRCFGFDEFYMQCGLLTSNHMEAASRAPKFRRKGLPIALRRSSHPAELTSARYPWETLEDGTEAAPRGFFHDHIFHMAAIPLSGWEYYCYTKDVDFLRDTVYPVLEACTGFFRLNSLYRVEGGKLIIGKCTDLERLGAHRENAYMTTCGVIATFRAFTEASRILNVNLDIAEECEKYAIELKAGLPNNGERYIPYPGCSERSISAFSGTHPFDVIERDDPLQIKAMEDFVEYEDSVGNMYTMGSGVCSWYACWKGVAYSRLGKAKEALATLRYVANTTGDFGEVFEINNAPSKTYIHPWFTTAAGMYVHAFNEALIQSTMTGEIYLLKGIDETFKNVRFKLSARGGLIVFFEMKNGKIERLDVVGNKFCTYKKVKVILPKQLGGECIVEVLSD